jgi:Na+-transporting NADH:ubiquinone oxidoreductase subunit NqrB
MWIFRGQCGLLLRNFLLNLVLSRHVPYWQGNLKIKAASGAVTHNTLFCILRRYTINIKRL